MRELNGWVPTEYRIPVSNIEVMIAYGNGTVSLGYFYTVNDKWFCVDLVPGREKCGIVKYWKPKEEGP